MAWPSHTFCLLPAPGPLLQKCFSRRAAHDPRRPGACTLPTKIDGPAPNSTLRKDIRLLLLFCLPASHKIWTRPHVAGLWSPPRPLLRPHHSQWCPHSAALQPFHREGPNTPHSHAGQQGKGLLGTASGSPDTRTWEAHGVWVRLQTHATTPHTTCPQDALGGACARFPGQCVCHRVCVCVCDPPKCTTSHGTHTYMVWPQAHGPLAHTHTHAVPCA